MLSAERTSTAAHAALKPTTNPKPRNARCEWSIATHIKLRASIHAHLSYNSGMAGHGAVVEPRFLPACHARTIRPLIKRRTVTGQVCAILGSSNHFRGDVTCPGRGVVLCVLRRGKASLTMQVVELSIGP